MPFFRLGKFCVDYNVSIIAHYTITVISHHFITTNINKMPTRTARLLHDVKSKQHLFIAKAGLAVTTEEMSSEQLWEKIYNQFKGHAAKFAFSGHLSESCPLILC